MIFVISISNFKIQNKEKTTVKDIIEKIQLKNKPKEIEEVKSVSILAVGDIMLSRNVASKIKKYNNPDYPFLKLKEILKSTDFNFANLESPITDGPEIQTGQMIFHANKGIETTLKDNNFQILSLANNHIPNFGDKGIKDTIELLTNVGIKFSGAGANEKEAYAPAYLETNGIKFAFLSYNDSDVVPSTYLAGAEDYGTAFMNIPKMQESIKIAKTDSDFVIVSMHSGTEYVNNPNNRQIEFARSAIDSGADLVIGHHPHVVQTMEKYRNKYIFYSLGNFIFDQMWSRKTKQGLIIKFIFEQNKNIKFSLTPIIIEDYCQPRIANEKEKLEILNRLKHDLANDPNYLSTE